MRLMPLLFAAALAASAAKANESAYSERNLDACKTLSQEDEGPSVTLECAGYKDLAVYFKEGDLRQSQAYGPISKAWLDEAFESFGPFNHTNAKIEWRIAAGRPVATIVRWFVSDPETTSDTDTRYGQVLVVSTIATAENPTSCVVGYIDALENKDANTLARKVADEEAHDFACGLNEPQWHGLRGKLAGEPVRHLPAAVE
ncbi:MULTISPECIES: hypothetical protein [unclassified Shinella]|uniref:hypothetical protein n=1 Tax=unclassified Shinella TaxID=2643062 RepID=UPI00225D7284|nr:MULTISPECIES: hypothetical protein [unclassified Shinella]MCO5140007.1 hypothetical protein [Shinella sp.]MDC7256975.1 hypothetical protein [Shinella sp. YE25]CAI0339868.1 conserved exported hypothetical protein [Rhizobiaceae bacterium]CAK7258258.1 conserved exported protein of unknown function [Shinella sp. WSC3-e]